MAISNRIRSFLLRWAERYAKRELHRDMSEIRDVEHLKELMDHRRKRQLRHLLIYMAIGLPILILAIAWATVHVIQNPWLLDR